MSHVVWIAGGVLIVVARNPRARQRLGQVQALARVAAHENYVEDIRTRYHLHHTARFASGTELFGSGKIQIDEGTYLGRHCYVCAQPAAAKVEIGRGCAISHSVHIRTASYRTHGDFAQAINSDLDWANIRIGNSVWIGAHVFITGGVTIGDNSIIGANSVVTRDVPPNSIVGGVPAHLIRLKDPSGPPSSLHLSG